MEEYEYEQLDKMLQTFYTEISTKDRFEYEPESLKSMLVAGPRPLFKTAWLLVLYNTRSRVPSVENWYLREK